MVFTDLCVPFVQEANFKDKDLKKYVGFLMEPVKYGQAGVREGSGAWARRDEACRVALRNAIQEGLSVADAERRVKI